MAETAKTKMDDAQKKTDTASGSPSSPRSTAAQKSESGNAQAINPSPERAVAFQTWGLSGSSDTYPSAAGGDAAVQRADNAETGERNRQRPIGKQQRDDEGRMREKRDDVVQEKGDEGQIQCEEDERSAGKWLSVHAGRDVYVSSGEVQKKGEEAHKKDEHGERKGAEAQKKGDQGQQEKGEKDQGKQQDSGEASKNNKQGKQEQAKKQSDGEEDEEGQKSHKAHGHPRGSSKKEKLKRRLPRWPTVAMVCVLSLIFGVGGAWAYSALFGSSKSEEKGDSSDKGGGGSKSSGGSKSGGSGGSDSDQSSEIKDLKKNLGDLDDGIKQLTARLDRLTESLVESRLPVPEYFSGTSRIARMTSAAEESPPILPNALSTQLNVLQRKVEQMSDLSKRVHALEELVPVLQEEIKMLEARRSEP